MLWSWRFQRVGLQKIQQSLLDWCGLWDDGRLITGGWDEAYAGQGEEDQPAGGPGGRSGVQAGNLGCRGDLGADAAFDEAEHQQCQADHGDQGFDAPVVLQEQWRDRQRSLVVSVAAFGG